MLGCTDMPLLWSTQASSWSPALTPVRLEHPAEIRSLLSRRCAFRDYIHECVGNVCPGQNSHTYPDAVEKEWTAGDY